MQDMLGMGKNKRMLFAVSVGSIIIIALGLYLFFFGTPKQVFLANVNNFNNQLLTWTSQNLTTLNLYNKDHISNVDLKYYIEKNNGNSNVVLENDMNIHINKSENNSHDIFKVTLPNQEENKEYNLYYQNGTLILDASQYDRFVKLNNKTLKYINATPDTASVCVDMYERIYKQFIKQLKGSDFYKISVKEDLGEGIEKIQKCGISISHKRLNELIVDTIKSLSQDETFINLYIAYQKQIDINSSMDKTSVINLMNTWIEDFESREIKENKIYEIVICTTGIFNENIRKIELFELEYNKIIKNVDIIIQGNIIKAQIHDNDKTHNIEAVKNEFGYSISLQGEDDKLNIVINDYLISKELQINGILNGNKLTVKYSTAVNNNQAIKDEIYIDLNNGEKSLIYVDLKNETKFKTVTEYIETKRLYSIEEVEQEVRQYVEMFKLDVLDRLGISIDSL